MGILGVQDWNTSDRRISWRSNVAKTIPRTMVVFFFQIGGLEPDLWIQTISTKIFNVFRSLLLLFNSNSLFINFRFCIVRGSSTRFSLVGPTKVKAQKSFCPSYQLSPSNQGSHTIFDNPISLKWREEISLSQMFSII